VPIRDVIMLARQARHRLILGLIATLVAGITCFGAWCLLGPRQEPLTREDVLRLQSILRLSFPDRTESIRTYISYDQTTRIGLL